MRYGIEFCEDYDTPPEMMVGETLFDGEGVAVGWVANNEFENAQLRDQNTMLKKDAEKLFKALELCCWMFRAITADDGSFRDLREQGFLDGYKDESLGTYDVADEYRGRLLRIGGYYAVSKLQDLGIEVPE